MGGAGECRWRCWSRTESRGVGESQETVRKHVTVSSETESVYGGRCSHSSLTFVGLSHVGSRVQSHVKTKIECGMIKKRTSTRSLDSSSLGGSNGLSALGSRLSPHARSLSAHHTALHTSTKNNQHTTSPAEPSPSATAPALCDVRAAQRRASGRMRKQRPTARGRGCRKHRRA